MFQIKQGKNNDPSVTLAQAQSFHNSGRLLEAKRLYIEIVKQHPQCYLAFNGLAYISLQMGNLADGIDLLRRSLKINSDQIQVMLNLGAALNANKMYQESVKVLSKVVELKPNMVLAHFNLAVAQKNFKRLSDALKSYDRVIKLDSNFIDAYINKGLIENEERCFEGALESYDQAIKIRPDYAEAHYNRGIVLVSLKRFDEALASYDQAIKIRPDYAEVYLDGATLLSRLHRFNDALASYDQAIRYDPDCAMAQFYRASLFSESRNYVEAIEGFLSAQKINPNIPFLLGSLLDARMQICDWLNFSEIINQIKIGSTKSEPMTLPFAFQSQEDDLEMLKKVSEIFFRQSFSEYNQPSLKLENYQHGKIRLAYVSGDYRNHPVMSFMETLFEKHDKNKFELIALSLGPKIDDDCRRRVEKSFSYFFDVRDMTDQEILKIAHDLEVDIAIDLTGYTHNARTSIFASRLAPVQINYLGFTSTTATDAMDYIIADQTVIPEEFQPYFTEKVIYMPGSYWVTDLNQDIPSKEFSRAEMGLPEDAFIFCCFNTLYKITPDIFSGWMRILSQVENSYLWIATENEVAIANLKAEAEKRGVSSSRLIFAPRMEKKSDHLARIKLADLFLDTFPFNAHTTASDALRAGLPLLTLSGKSFASRVSASLLNELRLKELVTDSFENYENKAVSLAQNPRGLKDIRSTLSESLGTATIFNTDLYIKNLESAYNQVYERSIKGQPPTSLTV